MAVSTYIEKADVMTSLRSADRHDRADWVDRIMPDHIDVAKNAAVLRMLGIDVESLPPAVQEPGGPSERRARVR